MTLFQGTQQVLDGFEPMQLSGSVVHMHGLTVRVADLPLPVGATVHIESRMGSVLGEVAGFDDQHTIVMPIGKTSGVQRGDRVVAIHHTAVARVGEAMLGRVINGLGQPIDGHGPLVETEPLPLDPGPLDPLYRTSIDEPLGTGVRAVDAMLTLGKGQRMGIFSGPGVGKSSLLGQIAQNTQADVCVIALIGERGREVRDFLERSLGPEGMKKSVVIVATGDEPAPLRVRAAQYATSVAEYYRDMGKDVLLMMDSITRFCQAQRQIGLAIGEPPTTKGYTPSVFAMLPSLLERSGKTQVGSITGIYAILVEGDDLTEPISDACRGVLDGHIVLSRDLADKAHWPAIDVRSSISRVMNDVTDEAQQASRAEVVRLLAAYHEVEDLVNIGAYTPGANPHADVAMALMPQIDELLQQKLNEPCTFEQARKQLMHLALNIGQQTRHLKQAQQQRAHMQAAGPTSNPAQAQPQSQPQQNRPQHLNAPQAPSTDAGSFARAS